MKILLQIKISVMAGKLIDIAVTEKKKKKGKCEF